ncbi:PAS domain-containing protein [Lysobacter claricitrinus]|uniref:PAS domain-containing protein n=1 Tax=Lysobacter claricitrinus TaxID=3367728 RepID=UPI0038B2830E
MQPSPPIQDTMPARDLPAYMHDPGAFPLLGNLKARPRDIRVARILVGILAVAFLLTAPFATRQWPAIPAFMTAYDVAIAALSLFTVVLLHGQYRVLQSSAYIWLGCGYAFAGTAALVHGLSVTDAFVPGTLFGNRQTPAWLWMAWHGVFPLFVLGFIFSASRKANAQAVRASHAYAATFAAVASLAVITVVSDRWLPPLIVGSRFSATRLHLLALAWVLHVIAIALMARRARERRLIDLWIAVALTADAIDLALSGLLVTGRYQLGVYVGRMYGLVTTVSVLALLLLQMFELQRRFVQARDDLRMHERRYGDLFRSMSEAFYVVRACRDDDRVVDLRYVERNPAADDMVGEAMLGRTAREIDPEFDARWLDVVARVLDTGEPEEFEWLAPRTGRVLAYRVFRAEHHHDLAGVLFNDVTDARRAEAALAASEARQRILVQGVPQLLWRTDAHGQRTWASPQWSTYTGQSGDEMLGTGWMDVVHDEDREHTHARWIAAHATGRLDIEHRLRAADGSYRWHRSRSEPHHDVEGRIDSWLGSSTDIHEMKTLQHRQSVLVAELQHRTRNLLAVVRALADRTARDSGGLVDFRATFRDRLDALARAQSLLSRLDDSDRVTFEEILQAEMFAISGVRAAQDDGRVVLDGLPNVRLRSGTVQTLALALHELATNALKYGALSAANGRLEVRWTLLAGDDGAPRLKVVWKESGMRIDPDAPVQGGGYGRELIERALPYQLGASTLYAIEADGVRCEIVMPVSVQPPAVGSGATPEGIVGVG